MAAQQERFRPHPQLPGDASGVVLNAALQCDGLDRIAERADVAGVGRGQAGIGETVFRHLPDAAVSGQRGERLQTGGKFFKGILHCLLFSSAFFENSA